ncbi:hypothetical protein BDQ17DRAFT_1331220 [Cyathus striatus]|nr:hypothetical protein BDQ17DRAFT_1331220 [Cyathus striatus]
MTGLLLQTVQHHSILTFSTQPSTTGGYGASELDTRDAEVGLSHDEAKFLIFHSESSPSLITNLEPASGGWRLDDKLTDHQLSSPLVIDSSTALLDSSGEPPVTPIPPIDHPLKTPTTPSSAILDAPAATSSSSVPQKRKSPYEYLYEMSTSHRKSQREFLEQQERRRVEHEHIQSQSKIECERERHEARERWEQCHLEAQEHTEWLHLEAEQWHYELQLAIIDKQLELECLRHG